MISDEEQTAPDGRYGAAWVDSDDERLTVSLASNPRLRKLRIAESEDLISGKEYIKRLRHQFERLYPAPDWAHPSKERPQKKRRRFSDSSASPGVTTSSDDLSPDSEELSTQPLAKLLQNTGNFTLPVSANSAHRRRLRPDVIDMQRTKDVGISQLVSFDISIQCHY